MNNIDEMPAKCKACPYWEACEYPYICQDTEPKTAENGNINAGIAENLQNRPTDGDYLISSMAAIDAVNDVLAEYIPTFRPWQEGIPLECALKIKALPQVQPKRGRWLKDGDAHYCSECGVGLIEFGQGGEPIYFVEGYNRANHERRITTPGWCSYYMQFCPHCGADMRGGEK